MRWKKHVAKGGTYWHWQNKAGFWARIYRNDTSFDWYLAKGMGDPSKQISPVIVEGETSTFAEAKVRVQLALQIHAVGESK